MPAGMGSIAERWEFFCSGGKPPYGFRDRSRARRMTGNGSTGEWRLSP